MCRLYLEDLESLGALSNIRASIRPAYDVITTSLVSQVVKLTFCRPAAMTVPAAPTTDKAGSGRSAAAAAEAAGPPTHHNRISALLAERQDTAAVRLASGGIQVHNPHFSLALPLAVINSMHGFSSQYSGTIYFPVLEHVHDSHSHRYSKKTAVLPVSGIDCKAIYLHSCHVTG